MEHKINLKYVFLLVVYLFCCGFTTGLYDETKPGSDLPQGDPDPNKGIIVRPNSTAFDVLRESSNSVKLGIVRSARYKKPSSSKPLSDVMYVSTPFIDKVPKTFNYVDGDKILSIGNTYAHHIYFSNNEDHSWAELRFYTFKAYEPQDKVVVEKKLNDICMLLKENGWAEITHSSWPPFEFPSVDKGFKIKRYKRFKHDDTTISLNVKVGIPKVHKFDTDHPKFNIIVFVGKSHSLDNIKKSA